MEVNGSDKKLSKNASFDNNKAENDDKDNNQ